MNDERNIHVTVAGIVLPLTVSSEKQEELMRKAASKVNSMLNMYRGKYTDQSIERFLAMVALHATFKELLLEDRNDTEPFKQKLKELTKDLEEYLKKDGNNPA